MDTFEFAQRVLRLITLWRDEVAEETDHPRGEDYHEGHLAAHEAILAGLRSGFEHLFNEQPYLLDDFFKGKEHHDGN